MSTPSRPRNRHAIEIAIICALLLEADAIEALFDRHWDDGPPFDRAINDPNTYTTGVLGCHNIVLAHMPGMGLVNAAALGSILRSSFPGIKLALVVGICGVVPFTPTGDEIVLGDVIISTGIIQYDFGRFLPGRFIRKDTLLDSLSRPNLEIRGVLSKLETLRGRNELSAKLVGYLDALRRQPDLRANYPGPANDKLFKASYHHKEDQKSCEQILCNGELVLRNRLEKGAHPAPTTHLGLIASGNAVMKSGEDRDRLAAAEGVIAFEMEGAGVWDCFPSIVIKGACDYADSHKSKDWQRYAAATAAACTKAFLTFWSPSSLNEGVPQNQPVWSVPHEENDLFVGRDDVLNRLQNLLFKEESQRVALVGLGGIGKTRIALRLAFWAKENKPCYSIFWMSALSMASFKQDCMNLAKSLGIECSQDDDEREIIKQHLSSRNIGKWFLVIDNADDVEILCRSEHDDKGILDFLPTNRDGRILLTTRSNQIAVTAARNKVVKLLQMSLEEASELLKKSLIDDESGLRNDELCDKEIVEKLLKALTCLPLAIKQAAAYMNFYESLITEYIQILEDKDDRNVIELLQVEHDDETFYDSSQKAVATTWIVSFDRLRLSFPEAADLLSFITFIEPKAIPRSIFPKLETEKQMTQAIGTLLGHSFLTRRVHRHEAMYDMHSLVHLISRKWNENLGYSREMRDMALIHVGEAFPQREWENRELWRPYLPHAIKLFETARSIEDDGLFGLGYQVGQALLVEGRSTEAVSILRDVVLYFERTRAKSNPGRLLAQRELGRAYISDHQANNAVELLESVAAIQEETLAKDNPDRLAVEHNLAVAYRNNNQNDKSLRLLEQVAPTYETISPKNHINWLAAQHNLAMAYRTDHQIKKAIEILKHVVAMIDKTLPEDHPTRLSSQHNLAMAYHDDKQHSKAADLLQFVVMTRETVLAEDHTDLVASQQNLAVVYLDIDENEKAIELLERVVAIKEKILAEDDESRLGAQHNLAVGYLDSKQMDKAIKGLEHVVSMKEKIFAQDHESRLNSQYELGRAYIRDGQFNKAVKILQQVLIHRQQTLTDDDYRQIATRNLLIQAYSGNNQLKEKIQLLEHTVRVERNFLPESHMDRLKSQQHLAQAYLDDGQTEEAVKLLEHIVAIKNDKLAQDDTSRLTSLKILADAYYFNKQLEKAIEISEVIVAIHEKILAEDDPGRLASEDNLALAYIKIGQTDEKIVKLLSHVIAIKERTLDEEDESLLESQHMLGVVFFLQGQFEKALELFQRVVEIRGRTLAEDNYDRQESEHNLQCCIRRLEKASISTESEE
ncbi:Nephrocystin-3 [Fusarium beomiforme]|uniref:Nephrocystin-3 n=1 Tax=Fusarium beomiforme TaxID=44412 RepID=A0A9P5DY01_9HYPO|nr:Nephrocystin-3 [Fusarium beomiforme]